jgi:hypothetical protein
MFGVDSDAVEVYRQVEGLKMDISCPKHVVGITK